VDAGATPPADAEPGGDRSDSGPRHGGRGPGPGPDAEAFGSGPLMLQGCSTQRRCGSRITLVLLHATSARRMPAAKPDRTDLRLAAGIRRGVQQNAASIGALPHRRNSLATSGRSTDDATASRYAERDTRSATKRRERTQSRGPRANANHPANQVNARTNCPRPTRERSDRGEGFAFAEETTPANPASRRRAPKRRRQNRSEEKGSQSTLDGALTPPCRSTRCSRGKGWRIALVEVAAKSGYKRKTTWAGRSRS